MISFLQFINEYYIEEPSDPVPTPDKVYWDRNLRCYRWKSNFKRVSDEKLEKYNNDKTNNTTSNSDNSDEKNENLPSDALTKKEIDKYIRIKKNLKRMPKEEIPYDLPIDKLTNYLKKHDDFEIPFDGYTAKIVKDEEPNLKKNKVRMYVTSVRDKKRSDYIGKKFDLPYNILSRTLKRLNKSKQVVLDKEDSDEIEFIKKLSDSLPDDFVFKFSKRTDRQPVIKYYDEKNKRDTEYTYDAEIIDTKTGQKYMLEFNGVHVHPKTKNQKYKYGAFKGLEWTVSGQSGDEEKNTLAYKYDRDEDKKKLAKENGYKVIIVWSDDYERDPLKTIENKAKILNTNRENFENGREDSVKDDS